MKFFILLFQAKSWNSKKLERTANLLSNCLQTSFLYDFWLEIPETYLHKLKIDFLD